MFDVSSCHRTSVRFVSTLPKTTPYLQNIRCILLQMKVCDIKALHLQQRDILCKAFKLRSTLKTISFYFLSLVSIQSLSVVDGLSRSLENLGRWKSLSVVGGLLVLLTVFHGR